MEKKSIKIIIEESGVNYFVWDIITNGFFKYNYFKKYIGAPLKSEVMLLKNNFGYWGLDIDNLKELSESSLQKLKNGNFKIKELKKQHILCKKKILNDLEKIKIYFKLNNKKMLAKQLEKVWIKFSRFNILGVVVIWADIEGLLSKELKHILKIKSVNKEEIDKNLSLLVSDNQYNLQWNKKRSLLKIACKYKNYKTAINGKEFKSYCKNNSWIQYGYSGPELKTNYFANQLKKIYKESPKKILLEHNNYFKIIKNKQIKLEQRLHLTKKEKDLFKFARNIMHLKLYRMEVRSYFHWLMDSIFYSLSKEYQIPLKWFHYAERYEIINLLKGKKINVTTTLKKSDYLLRIRENDKIKFYDKITGEKFLNRVVIKDNIKQASVLKGNVAFPGKVSGVVKIVNSIKDITKVKKGNILVSMATNPDLLPAMQKAAAFITNSGGITSHAAIVSREMKIPCIIGTKIATKVLKDGDLVEVDANKGVVKKIK